MKPSLYTLDNKDEERVLRNHDRMQLMLNILADELGVTMHLHTLEGIGESRRIIGLDHENTYGDEIDPLIESLGLNTVLDGTSAIAGLSFALIQAIRALKK
jgi:hypothetical protein